MNRSHFSVRGLAASAASVALVGVSLHSASAETRGYVVEWFTGASYNQDGDCIGGVNPTKDEQEVLDLLAAGYTKEQIETWDKDPKKYGGEKAKAVRDRGRIHGEAVNSSVNPASVADPHLHRIGGKFAFGFNLDGKGEASPNSFEDPKTHEKGVNNQMFRAMGCTSSFRGDDKIRPTVWQSSWDIIRPGMPAWLISISGADLNKDGDATITFDRAREHIERDANSNVEADLTFRIDPDPRSHVTFPAKIKDGVLTITEHGDLRSVWGEQMLFTELRLRNTHLRLTLKPDGTLDGILGGYQPWIDLYSGGWEANGVMDMPGLYYALKQEADSNPDPKTGQNRDISTAYRIEAVPAFLVHEDKTAQADR